MKKMNKILTTVLVIALAALTLVGCAKKIRDVSRSDKPLWPKYVSPHNY